MLQENAQSNQIPFLNVKINFLKNAFFPAVITEWNNLDISIFNSYSYHIFKNLILKFIRPEPIEFLLLKIFKV